MSARNQPRSALVKGILGKASGGRERHGADGKKSNKLNEFGSAHFEDRGFAGCQVISVSFRSRRVVYKL
ncbi:hypothetical protein MCOR25_010873 [Pyricularia grisea]|uniref:Uncharacterized protein n=1 Tax=Pyricularia grisea TaxID=148305 RepID=A0A6P8B1I3_PYRGI|nr:uncharacterized protein PgNI_07943 [Pyricularia grisea]KAI6347843.1 hypothetical protein MCOR25_010873 [Pyricularia grisea]TLD08689.1 hypothetical protein PgNI_07943 [Pyricularia grisea]